VIVTGDEQQGLCRELDPAEFKPAAAIALTSGFVGGAVRQELSGWPDGVWVIAREERPHPGAQLRVTDADGLRITALTTKTCRGNPPTRNSGTPAAWCLMQHFPRSAVRRSITRSGDQASPPSWWCRWR
jgi:hypothetical protein